MPTVYFKKKTAIYDVDIIFINIGVTVRVIRPFFQVSG